MLTDSLLAGTPQMLGRYELLAPVARGGMGQVWVGRLCGARGFNKLVAVKTLLAAPDAEGRLESMLLEEARLAALVHHANVVQTLELGEHEKTLYLVMEWIDGESLGFIQHHAQPRGGIPLAIAVNWVGQTLLGLHAAHELTDDKGVPLGVVHRDVSPHNVLVTYSGVAKLVDFGIAKATNQTGTHSGEIKGKISYMAPEQIRAAAVDRRADIFAVGITLYLLTTGRHPFESPNSASMLQRICGDDRPPPPSSLVAGYPRVLEEVVMKALEKAPEQRWQSAEHMLVALRQAVPEAFESGFEGRLKEFLREVLGDRAAKRREALRRAQLAADSRPRTAEIASPAQSGTSLRALSVDNRSADSGLPRDENALPKPARRPGRSAILIGAAGLAGLLGALAIGHVGALNERERAGLSSGMAELPSAAVAPSAQTEAAARATVDPPARSVAAAASASALAAGVAERKRSPSPATVSSSVSARPERRKPRHSSARSSDLMRPDYAR